MPEYLTPLSDIYKALDGPHGSNYALFEQTKRLVEDAHFPDAEAFAARTMLRFLDRCEQSHTPYPYHNVAIYMLSVCAGLYEGERFTNLSPNPADYGFGNDHVILGQMRDFLLRQQQKAINPSRTIDTLADTLIAAFLVLTRALPPIAQGSKDGDIALEDTLSIPLIDVLPPVGPLIERVLKPFSDSAVRNLGLFEWLRSKLEDNAKAVTERLRKTRPVFPSEFEGAAEETVRAFLGETTLDNLFLDTRVPFTLPLQQRFAGHWIIAPPGRGKTNLLHSMVLEDLTEDASIIVLDSKGDLLAPLKELADIKDRLLIVEPDPDAAIALNPLDVTHASVTEAVSLIEYVMAGLLEAKFTALQSTLFRNVVPAIIQGIDGPTLETFKGVMVHGLPKDAIPRLDPPLQRFFLDRETGFHSKTYESTRKEVVWRLDFLLTNPVLRSMFSAIQTRLDIGKEMDAGRVILINNSKAILGDEGAEFFGRFFIALIARAAQRRATRRPEQKKPCFVYIDECQTVIAKDTRIPILLDECRSQKIALILSHQRTAQLTAPVLDAVANCAIRYANSDDEARYLSDKLRATPEFLRSLPTGKFAAFVRDLTPHALAISVPLIDLSAYAKMNPAEGRQLTDRMKAQYGLLAPPPAAPAAPPPAAPAPMPPATPSTPPATPDPKRAKRLW